MKRYLFLLAGALLLGAPFAARAEDAPPVKPLELLKRAVDAQAKLGPASIEVKTEFTYQGYPWSKFFVDKVQRNDDTHSFTVEELILGKHTEYTEHQFVNGEDRVTYNPKTKEYGRTPDEHDIPKECLDAVRGGLLYPDQSQGWEKAKVKTLKFEGKPAHRITVKNLGIHHRNHDDPEALTLTIDDATGLVLQSEVNLGDDFCMVTTSKYKPESKPFPDSTFVFVAPEGAKESAPRKIELK